MLTIFKKDPKLILVTVRQYCANCATKKNKVVPCVDGKVRLEKCDVCESYLLQIVLTEGE